jgi:hypothetical protein
MATSLLRLMVTASTNSRQTLVVHAVKRQPNIDHTYGFSRMRSLATTATAKNPSEHSGKIEIKPMKRRNYKKYFAMFVAGVGTYVGLSLYWNFFRDEKADTSPSAVQYKPGVIQKVSKTVCSYCVFPNGFQFFLFSFLFTNLNRSTMVAQILAMSSSRSTSTQHVRFVARCARISTTTATIMILSKSIQ